MLIILIIFLCLIFSRLHLAKENTYFTDYLSRETTQCIEGVFVVLVFIRHFSQYLSLDDAIDLPLKIFSNSTGQLIVGMFLFYTGYGTMMSIMRKGKTYVNQIFVHKFLKLLLHFDICMLLFVIYNLLVGKQYPLLQNILAFTSWTSIGNSNWYITAILAFYLIIIISFSPFQNNTTLSLILSVVFSVVLVFVFKSIGRPTYCYNTFLVLPLGMCYCFLRDKIEAFLHWKSFVYPMCLCTLFVVMAISQMHASKRFLFYLIWVLSFVGVVVLLSMKVKLSNSLFCFLGKHVFSIYILQRIPMMFFIQIGVTTPLQMFICSAAVTIVSALAFDNLVSRLDKYLFTPRVSQRKTNVAQQNSIPNVETM